MRTEKALSIIAIIGVLFKLMHWPGGGVILVLSLSTLSIIYFPGSFYFFSDKTIKQSNRALSIVSGIFLSLIPIGVLFKIQYYSGSSTILIVGLMTVPVFLALSIYLKSKASEELKTYYNNMILRTTIWSILALFFYLIPSASLLKMQYRNDAELLRLKTLHYEDPYNKEYRKQHDDYIFQLDSLEMERNTNLD